MEPDRFARLKEILLQASNLPEAERAALLDTECADDPEMRQEVEALLAHEADRRTFLESGKQPPTRTVSHRPDGPAPAQPREIGGYKITRKLGEGGMGIVYEAEQTEPVHRRVALKVIRAGMDTKEVVARFEAERQALALMDHPGIAKVFDAGTTPEGRPYFAMEYVPGVPITEYCDTRRLGTRERLELFQRVCEGVQHAHQKAVIHRDLKPSNILVADVDGKPQPRIIDFGVAKATTQKLTEKTMHTALGQLIGTPEYMSPEQADLTVEDIDTRTDVYSLGVVLYELLAGALPFDATQLRQAGFEGIIKLLREKDPPRPSTKVSSLGERTTDVAKKRRTEPRRLAGQLRGDLDWIVMRSLEKDRNRRYGTPHELAQDIGRHLRHEPVLAGPPSPIYRTRKFVRRHRIAIGFTATIGLAVILGFVLLAVQNARIAAARDEAELVTSTLEEMLASVDPTKSGRDVTVKEMLDETAKTLGEKFKGQPLVEARLRHTVGWTYLQLGEYDIAIDHLEQAAMIQREGLGMEDATTLSTVHDLARVYTLVGRSAEAEPLAREVLDISRLVLGEEDPQTLNAMLTFGISRGTQGNLEEAEALYRACLEIGRRVLGPEHPQTRRALGCLAVVAKNLGRYDEAAPLMEENLESNRRAYGEEDPRTLLNMSNLANIYDKQGRVEEAEALYLETLEIRRRILGEEHPQTLASLRGLARFYQGLGRHDAAEPFRHEELEIKCRILGDEHPQTLNAMDNLAMTYMDLGRYVEAETLWREQLEIRRRVLGEECRETLNSLLNLGYATSSQDLHDEAEALNRRSLEISRRALGEDDDLTNAFRYNLACAVALQGRRSEAILILQEALDNGARAGQFFFRVPSMLEDSDLASLHGDPEFEALVEELKRRNERAETKEQETGAE